MDARANMKRHSSKVSSSAFIWLLPLLLSGCTVLSKKLIDSPSAEGGHPIRDRIIHEEVKPGSASEALWVHSISDSDVILKLRTKAVKAKTTWFGMVFPIFPAFFIPTKNFYSDSDSLLKFSFWIKSNAEVQVFPDSTVVVMDGKEFAANKSSIWGVPSEPQDSREEKARNPKKYTKGYSVWFPIDARKVRKYELKVKVEKNGPVDFPRIVCTRKWQERRFFGP